MVWDCDEVKCGFWVNESNSQGFRYILTLPVWHSYILTSFFTLFVKFSGEYLWATVLFIVHQIKASPKAQDDMYHQIQLVLRNTESQSALIKGFMQIIRAHKSSRFEAYRRTLFLIVLASFYGLTLFLASTLSSYIITTQDTSVLAVSRSCGWIEEPDFSNEAVIFADKQAFDTSNALSIVGRNSFTRSAGYSRSCYSHFGGNATTCKSYVKTTLPYTLKRGMPCPFSGRVCNGTAISLDTGYLRSDTDLGINTRSGDSLAIRKVLTCVPVAGEQYATPWTSVPENIASGFGLPPGTKFKAYELGKHLGIQLPPPLNDTNYTFIIHEAQHNFSEIKYELEWATSNVDLPNSPLWYPFIPIPDLLNRSADTTLIGLRSKMSFPRAVMDPWFIADECSPYPLQPQITLCKARNPYSFLACQEQYQFCHTSSLPASAPAPSGSCTPLAGLYALSPEVLFMKNSTWNGSKLANLNPAQQGLYKFLGRLLSATQLNFQLGFIGRENLVAREYDWDGGFDFGYSAPLPSDHWESEVSNWMNVSLSGLQRGTISFSRPTEVLVGGGNSSFQFIATPQDPEVQGICHKIKVQSAEHTSYSVTGMTLTLLVGFLCIVSNMFISKLVFCIQRRSGHGRYKRAEWNDSSAFQLLRIAAEGRGIGPWQGRDKEVPTLVEYSHLFKLGGETVRQYEGKPAFPIESGLKQQYTALAMENEYTGGDTVELQTVMGTSGVRRYDDSTTRLL